MKKMKLAIVPLVIALSASLLYACSADEVDEPQPTDKAQLLLAKSREFARKYGVDVKLNEENIEEIARTKTVEELEADYRAFAEAGKDTFVFVSKMELPQGRGMNLRANTSLEEEIDPERDKVYKGEHTFDFVKFQKIVRKGSKEYRHLFSGSVTVYYRYGLKVHSYAHGSYDFESSLHNRCSGSFNLNPFFSTSNGFAFSGESTVLLTNGQYVYSVILCVAYSSGNVWGLQVVA